ncbi:MAG: AAA family ATPase [Zoogloea sp.]|nr:AAA family ATPase [Zoogloea sp.]
MTAPLPPWLEDFRARHDATVIETHISWLLLAGALAWKVKKPIRLPFLDYGSVERRRRCCEEELRLNRQFAPDLYLGLEVVGRSDGGEEWAVRMRRFPEEQRLDHVCAHRHLRLDQLSELAATLQRFHAGTAVAGPDCAFGEPEQVFAPAIENFTELAALAPDQAHRLAPLETWTRDEYARIRPTLAARKAAGRVRECHGDLHLGNLVLLDDRITPFDCIEFNDNLRWIDVASEIAFTYIDLLDHQRPDLATWLLNEWLTVSGDFEAMKVLRFYAVYRAMVRAKVAGLGGEREGVDAYLRLAGEIASPPPPRLTITFGVSGSGKTTASADLLLADASATTVRLRSDVERKRLFGLGPLDDSRAVPGGIYTPDSTLRTYTMLHDTTALLLSAGWSVVVDAAFLRRDERTDFLALASAHGARMDILACSAPDSELRRRLMARHGDASEATVDVLDRQLRWMEALDADELARVIGPA